MRQMTITCPFNANYRVVLDKDQVIADDPGAGTPEMVYGPNGSCGTLYAAQSNGELVCGTNEHTLPGNIVNWLDSIDDEVAEFLY